MLFQLEKRDTPSKPLIFATPFISIVVTVLLSGTLLVNAGAVLSFKLGAPTSLDSGATTKDRFVALLASLRLFRVVIGIWNVFLVFLMVVWFP